MMSASAPDSVVSPSPIDQLSSLLSLSQQIRTATDTGQPLSKLDLMSKLDTILPSESFSPHPIPSPVSPPYNCSTPHRYQNDLLTSMDSGLALTGSFSSLYESDESVISPHTSSGRRANRSLNLRPPSAKNHRNKRSTSPQQDAQMFTFLQNVSAEFSTSLRALLEKIDREAEKKSDELTGSSGSDVTLPEIEPVQDKKDINQLIEKNSLLLNTCKQLKARVKEERREGKNLRRENTSLMLEREGLLSKMSETEREIIEKLSEHGALMESYSGLEERLKERERSQRETQARITAMEVEVNKLTDLLTRVQQDLSSSIQREDEYRRENLHLEEELVLKENEVNELKSAAQRVQSHARILSALDKDVSSSHDAYMVGLVSTDEILRDTASLCQQLDSLTGLFGKGTSYDLSQIKAGLSHALADGNILLQNIAALKNEHEHCKDALFELQQNASEYKSSKSDEDLNLLAKIAEMAPILKMEAERLAEQWDEPITQQNYLILSQLREILTDYTGREVTNESLISTLSALLACRDRDMNQSVCSMNSESAELEGRLQESSLLLSNMSVALNGEQMKRRSQVRALKKKILRDSTLLKNLQLERDTATGKEQLIKREISNLCENVQCGDFTNSSLGITQPCVRELAKLVGEMGSRKITALEESLKAAYYREDKTVKLLEFKLAENEKYYEQVRQLTLDRVKIEGVNTELQTAILRIEEQLIMEREDSETRENLLTTKLRIVQEHIQKYDDVMFAELDKLSIQVKDDTMERDLQQRREESSIDVFKKMKEELCMKQDEVQFLEKEVTVYKLKLHNLENSHNEEIEKLKLSNEPEKPFESQKVHFNQDLPDPSPLILPPMTSLKGQELRTALGVALTQEQLYAKAHLSLQTERDNLASENKQLRDRINTLHQRMTDPRGLLATHRLSLVSQEVSSEEIRLQLENDKLSNHVTELNTRVSKLSHYRNLYFDSKLKFNSLLWQKSYLKSQLNVYFSSLLASGLILGDLGVGGDKIRLNRVRRGCSKFRCYVWVVIFTHRLSHSKWGQQNILYLNYTPSLPLHSRRYQY